MGEWKKWSKKVNCSLLILHKKVLNIISGIPFSFSLLTCSYIMSNGYKPAPLDLSEVKLLPSQEFLVDKLAENAHNVWAKDRIKQGWTYGIQQVRTF